MFYRQHDHQQTTSRDVQQYSLFNRIDVSSDPGMFYPPASLQDQHTYTYMEYLRGCCGNWGAISSGFMAIDMEVERVYILHPTDNRRTAENWKASVDTRMSFMV